MKRKTSSILMGRRLWFSIHKWIGLLLLAVLIPLSASGSMLVWHDWTDGLFNPQRYDVSHVAPDLPPEAYLGSAQTVLRPGDRISAIDFPERPGRPVVVTASAQPGGEPRRGPPARYQVWLDPADARIVDHGDPRNGILRVLHVFHGSLMIPGWGRTIVGWLGVLMLVSCLTGILLWWPSIGSVLRGLRWRRGSSWSGNLHHQIGIWIALPLAILSFTGAYISFPAFFRSVEAAFGAGEAPRGPQPNRRARPVESPNLAPSNVIAAAREREAGVSILTIRWPTESSSGWTVTVAGEASGEVSVDDRTGEAVSLPPRGGVARFMRQLHDGHSYNALWQTIIFIGGFAPAFLGITGIVMWVCARDWRTRIRRKRASAAGSRSGGPPAPETAG